MSVYYWEKVQFSGTYHFDSLPETVLVPFASCLLHNCCCKDHLIKNEIL